MTVEALAGKVGMWRAPAAAGVQTDMVARAAAPGAAGLPRGRAGAAPEVPPGARADRAAAQVALGGPEAPAAVNMAGMAAAAAEQAWGSLGPEKRE